MSSRPIAVFGVSWLLFSLLAVLWSLATPISASPDEPAHMIKAASVVRGQWVGPDGRDGSIVQVPQYVAWTHAQTCFARNAAATADCIPAVPGDPGEIVDSSTTAGRYNPVYYVLVGWPTLLFSDPTGLFAMRIVSGVVASAFLALSAMMIARWKRRALPLIGLGVAVTPMVLFLNGSVNPNAWETGATLAAFVAMLGAVAFPDARLLAQRCAIVIVSASVAVNLRGISPVWVAAALLIPLMLASREQILALWRTRAVKVTVAVVGLASVAAVIWLASAGSIAGARDEPPREGAPEYIGASPLLGFFGMIAKTGDSLVEMVGNFGWLDTPAPVEVLVIWVLLIGSITAWALVLARGAALRFTVALFGAFLVLPALAQAAFIQGGGWIWQGRYTLPLLAMLLVGASVVLAVHFDAMLARTARLIGIVVAIGWSGGQLYSFAAALHRYTIGASESWIDMVVAPRWSPPLGVVPILALYALAGVVLAVLGARLARSHSANSAKSVVSVSEPE